jgi:hypothetical protein
MNKVFPLTTDSKEIFRIPIRDGYSILVKEGEEVEVGKALFKFNDREILDNHYLPEELDIEPVQSQEYILKLDGEFVEKGDILAEKTSKSGLTKRQIIAQAEGVISFKRLNEGHLNILSEKVERSFVSSFDGTVKEVSLEKGLGIETKVSFLKSFNQKFLDQTDQSRRFYGIFEILGKGNSINVKKDLKEDYTGKVVFAGFFAYLDLVEEILKRGASGVVVYSMECDDWDQINGNCALIGGYGQMKMPQAYLKLFKDFEGKYIYFDTEIHEFIKVIGIDANLADITKLNQPFKSPEIDDYVISREEQSFGRIGRIVDFEDDSKYALVSLTETDNRLIDLRELEIVTV